jgi:hypothetical protein
MTKGDKPALLPDEQGPLSKVQNLLRRGLKSASQATAGSPSQPPSHAQESDQGHTILYYGKEMTTWKTSLFPADFPDPLVSIEVLMMPCVLGSFNDSNSYIRPCGQTLQIPLDLAPSAVLCPCCFGLMFFDAPLKAGSYADADLRLSPDADWDLFGYAASPTPSIPLHADERELRHKIATLTRGGAVLLATVIAQDPEHPEWALSEGAFLKASSAFTSSDLDVALPPAPSLAAFISRGAIAAYQDGHFLRALGLAQRALVIDPDCEEAIGLLHQYRWKRHKRSGRCHLFASLPYGGDVELGSRDPP